MSVNQRLAAALEEISELLQLTGADSFRASANSRAARAIADYPGDIAAIADDLEALKAIPGVGAKIAAKIQEFVKTGKMKEREDLLKEAPRGLLDILRIPGVGPKTVRAMWQEKGVTSIDDLRKIIEDGAILDVSRMGAKTVENMKRALAFTESTGARTPLGVAAAIADVYVERLSAIKNVRQCAAAGSLRRGRDTIGDIDILVATKDPAPVSEAFRTMPEVTDVLAAGENKSSVRIRADLGSGGGAGAHVMQVDLRVVPPDSWGAALLYFTGSKQHNIRLRERALKRNLTLNEYGLFPEDDEDTPPQSRGIKPVAGKTEEDIYEALDLPWIPPQMREDSGEIDLKPGSIGGKGHVPDLVSLESIRAELHAHTTASDGALSIEELAEAAKSRGFHTIAVTDHSKSQIVANGLNAERLLAHIDAVRAADSKIKGITILAGTEVDILTDGALDYDDDLLAQLDIVVASPHWTLKQDPAAATKRLLKAIKHPLVHIIGHPTGRLINRREGLTPDISALVAAAAEHHTALEVNAHWARLDLRDVHVRAATDAGALIAIDCDVHTIPDFDNLRFGVVTARRGWLPAAQCINTWPARKLHDWLRAKRPAKPKKVAVKH